MAEPRRKLWGVGFFRSRDIVVPCERQGHKVRLARGVRFFARARCPKCHGPVDPTRGRRMLRLITNLRGPASDNILDVGLWALTVVVFVASVVTAVVFQRSADRWWLATMLLFGPRWVLLLPIPLLALVAAIRDRALLLPLGVAAGVIVGPVMGFQTGWRALLTTPDPGRDVTVATFNVRGGEELEVGPHGLMTELGADVAAFQECGYAFRVAIREAEGWHTWAGQSLCLVSRFPVLETRVMEADVIQRAGGSGLVVSHLLDGDEGPFWLTNVHLETPRAGLNLIRRGSLLRGIEVVRRDSFLREVEHRQARAFAAGQDGPHIVVGDFNTPPESRIYRSEWQGWTNAFSVAGSGLGGTRLNGWIRARIDHVVVDDGWMVVDAWLGQDVGSDHLPMVATVRRR
jgi:endonuclease/exonuclease/phosphatase (EEP) superfamily protein YafD